MFASLLILLVFLTSVSRKEEIHSNKRAAFHHTAAVGFKSTATTFKIEDALPRGFVKDGSVDYTTYIQRTIDKYEHVTFPGFPILVNSKGLKVPSNRILNFLPGSEIRMKPNNKGTYAVFLLEKVTNVTMNNPVIIGDRKSHLGTSGEWGMGIGIYSSTNIVLNGPKVSDCWGDGIYLGTSAGGVNKNIIIKNAFLKSNRRDGISIISVDGLLLDSPYAGFHTEKSPYSGINFEPNYPYNEVKNVTIRNAKTEYNKGQGIQFALKHLYGGKSKQVSANIHGFTDVGSRIAFKISANSSKRKGNETINGIIKVSNLISKNYTYIPVMISTVGESNLVTTVSKPKVIKSGSYAPLNSSLLDKLIKGSCVSRGSVYSIIY